MKLKHLGLFEGIGGFSLAARWMGWETKAWVEIDTDCQNILRKNFKNAKGYSDIKQFDGKRYAGQIDIITGGFPCQPFSTAGKQNGTNDDRSLWHEMFRVIREVKPKFVVAENVYGIVNMELDNILFDLESEGYQTETFVLPACSVGAPHQRKRVWIIANIDGWGRNAQSRICTCASERNSSNDADRSNADIGEQKEWMVEPDLVRVVYGVSRKLDKIRVKQLGNSIVPQLAFRIFQFISNCG
jgi:DNA (cytosine-5)-methyltransferase 1